MTLRAVASIALPQRSLYPPVSFEPIDNQYADAMLTAWGHYLGPCNRPFGRQSWALIVQGEPASIAVSASTVSATAAGMRREELVELARLCSAPGSSWATLPCLRLWRQIAGPLWPYWTPRAAIAYSANKRHNGGIYRVDGWRLVATAAGSSGGGTWSRKRDASDAAHGPKSLWMWEYDQ